MYSDHGDAGLIHLEVNRNSLAGRLRVWNELIRELVFH